MLKSTLAAFVTPATVTLTGPVVAELGTTATICVSDQLTTVGACQLNVIVLVPCVAPKPLPLTCTWVPTGPLEGTSPETMGLGNLKTTSALLPIPFTVTVTGPVETPDGI